MSNTLLGKTFYGSKLLLNDRLWHFYYGHASRLFTDFTCFHLLIVSCCGTHLDPCGTSKVPIFLCRSWALTVGTSMQVTSPVQWETTLKTLLGNGLQSAYELGPGKV